MVPPQAAASGVVAPAGEVARVRKSPVMCGRVRAARVAGKGEEAEPACPGAKEEAVHPGAAASSATLAGTTAQSAPRTISGRPPGSLDLAVATVRRPGTTIAIGAVSREAMTLVRTTMGSPQVRLPTAAETEATVVRPRVRAPVHWAPR